MENEKKLQAFFEAANLTVARHAATHWRLRDEKHQLSVDYWPTVGKAMAFGRVFQPSPHALVSAIKAGRIKMPSDAQPATCRDCGEPVWWTVTVNLCDRKKSGKRISVNTDGTAHYGTCGKHDQK